MTIMPAEELEERALRTNSRWRGDKLKSVLKMDTKTKLRLMRGESVAEDLSSAAAGSSSNSGMLAGIVEAAAKKATG
jgi:hypothetical protein